VCGGQLVARADDRHEAILVRLKDYRTKTEPIFDLFRRKELVVVVDGTHAASEVQQEIRRQLGLKPAEG